MGKENPKTQETATQAGIKTAQRLNLKHAIRVALADRNTIRSPVELEVDLRSALHAGRERQRSEQGVT